MRQLPEYRTLPEHPLGPYRAKPGGRPRSPSALPSCRGGHTCIHPSGYVLEYSPDHPAAHKAGVCRQHRLVLECTLGRLLDPSEVVHHKNGRKTDNRPENLELLTRQQHGTKHRAESVGRSSAPLDEQRVKEALRGRSTLEAARL